MTAGHLAMQVLSVRSVMSNELVPAGRLGLELGTGDGVADLAYGARIRGMATDSYDEPSGR